MPQITSTNKKTYAVHDHWTDINKKNDVDIISIDGDITRIKVNGEDYGGGGGSSDFSTAEVTFNSNTAETIQLMVPVATEEGIDIEHAVRNGRTLVVPLYNGSCIVGANDSYEGDFTDFSVTGNIRIDAEVGYIIVSGDGTITYTPAL